MLTQSFIINTFTSVVSDDLHVTVPRNWQYGFQTPYSPIMEGIIRFHDDITIFLTFILFFVLYIMYTCITHFGTTDKNTLPKHADFIHHPSLEIIWTIIPAVILLNIAFPSFSLLYSLDEIIEPTFTFKVVGHQWYWSYEILGSAEYNTTVLEGSDFKVDNTSFDSYMLADDDLNFKKANHQRLLTVDNHLPLPTKEHIRVLITSADVLHSWSVPSLGVKVDACPGRINQASFFIDRAGYFYGQCSELCGANHGFMPIGILAVNLSGTWKLPVVLGEALFLTALRDDR